MIKKADFIIVGGGSAGCVLANRLSADPDTSVVLIEAGDSGKGLLYKIPAGYIPLMQSGKSNWNYESVPQPGLNGRTMYFPRGKVLGGSSAINGMVVSRGNAGDYDHWAELGNAGWSYQDCLPYFQKLECYPEGDPEVRGSKGPMRITKKSIGSMNKIAKTWVEGCTQAGFSVVDDYNSGNPEGVAAIQSNYAEGLRQSASSCYLQPILKRSNLTVITSAIVSRVITENGVATGIEYLQGGTASVLLCEREVILSGGSINSPKLLQLSGIGDAAHLRSLGIDVVLDLPGVGKNLKDHVAISVKQSINKPYSLLSGMKPLAMIRALATYLLFKKGPVAEGVVEIWTHAKSLDTLDYPDLQMYAVPIMYNDHGRDVLKQEGFMVVLNGGRQKSSGEVRICSTNPMDAPEIDPRYFSCIEDLEELRRGIHLARRIISQPAFADFREQELAPGADATTDEALDSYIRNNALSIYHPVGTCKMGHDHMAVVDDQLRVRGIERLRVVDASIMPDIVSGNTNFPTMMIAEKAADMILGCGG